MVARWFWLVIGMVSLGLGFLGAALPLLPTTPFVLLAAFCFARSSAKFHRWLTTHRVFGPIISDWNAHGAISRKGKIAGTFSMLAAFTLSVVLGASFTVLLVQALVLGGSAVFVLSRPSPP